MPLKSLLLPGDLRIKGPGKRYQVNPPAIFLDFDGTLWPDFGPGSIMMNETILESDVRLLNELSKKGFLIVGITNQTFFGYQYRIKFAQIIRYRKRLRRILNEFSLDSIFLCHHHPNSKIGFLRKKCQNRKPQCGSILLAIQENSIDISRSYIIGDRITDILAGKNAHVPNRCLILNSRNLEWNLGIETPIPTLIDFRVYLNLSEALSSIEKSSRS